MRRRNPALWVALGITTCLLTAALTLAPLRALFGFAALHTGALATALGVGAVLLALLEWAQRGTLTDAATKQRSVQTRTNAKNPFP